MGLLSCTGELLGDLSTADDVGELLLVSLVVIGGVVIGGVVLGRGRGEGAGDLLEVGVVRVEGREWLNW